MGSNIPLLEDCQPGLRPTGFNVIVAMAPSAHKTAGGIHIPDSMVDKNKLTEVKGRLVAVSPAAFDFADFAGNAPQVGDIVQLARLSGVMVVGEDGRDYRIAPDKEIVAIVEEANG